MMDTIISDHDLVSHAKIPGHIPRFAGLYIINASCYYKNRIQGRMDIWVSGDPGAVCGAYGGDTL